jgi:hypothetical protein
MTNNRKLTRLIVALPEDYVIRLLACARMQFGNTELPLQSGQTNMVILQGIDRVFWEFQGKYSYSEYWESIQNLAKAELEAEKLAKSEVKNEQRTKTKLETLAD